MGFWAHSFEIPALTSPVMDEVGLLSPQARRQIEQNLFQFKASNQVQIQVYIVKSLQGEEIESAAIKIFDQWKLGDEKTDKGLLFLVAPNEKRMRIEVGQGLEGDLPDVIAKRIISDVVRPHFQSGQFAIGIAQGVSSIENYIVNSEPGSQAQLVRDDESERGGGKLWIVLIVIAVWIIIFIFNPSLALYILFSGMRGGGGGGGGFGGGSWGGGGGRSSGGGASGGW
ncbi:MAG: hypothetical protein K0R29_2179 [Pseudobdellovibrio sp.]|jgi:uncharacterized protein|nr:hypothetical protein [Pseudobdellovibrio sp.]